MNRWAIVAAPSLAGLLAGVLAALTDSDALAKLGGVLLPVGLVLLGLFAFVRFIVWAASGRTG